MTKRLTAAVSALFAIYAFSSFAATKARADASLLEDQVVTNSGGNKFVLTGIDGQLHPLTPQPNDSSITSCPSAQITVATGPDRVMLDEQGYISPVNDQGGRGTCNTFGAAGALESAYLVQYYKMTSAAFTAAYGFPLSLSEQYLVNIKNEARMAFHDSGSAVGNLEILAPYCGAAPAYGLPLATDWPYVRTDAEVEETMMQSVPGAPADTLLFSEFTTTKGPVSVAPTGVHVPVVPPGSLNPNASPYGVPMGLIQDLGNYSWSNLPASGPYGPTTASYPSQSVHEKALWAPEKVVTVQLLHSSALAECDFQKLSSFAPVTSANPSSLSPPASCLSALAAPLEQLLSEQHAMAISINWDIFKFNSELGAYVYNNPKNLKPNDDDHVVLLVGYDRAKQLFRFKNSWGTQWGDNGYGNITYDLLMRTLGTAVYVESVRDPNLGPVPNGVWRGFWQGKLGGIEGVAVIHHLYGVNSVETSTPAGIFYGNNGSQTNFNFLGWSASRGSYVANFGDMHSKPLFNLTMQLGSLNPTAQLTLPSGVPSGEQWSKCTKTPALGSENVAPWSYTEAATDSYVLPPCITPSSVNPWHVSPTWSCPKGGEYVSSISYNFDGATLDTIRSGCLKTTSAAPACPAGYALVPDALDNASHDTSIVSPGKKQWLDACGSELAFLLGGYPTAGNLGCDPHSKDLSKGGCPQPTCAAPRSVFGISGALLTLGSTQNGVWAVEGQDQCVEETYAAEAACPSGYALNPNGNDCIVYLPPAPPK